MAWWAAAAGRWLVAGGAALVAARIAVERPLLEPVGYQVKQLELASLTHGLLAAAVCGIALAAPWLHVRPAALAACVIPLLLMGALPGLRRFVLWDHPWQALLLLTADLASLLALILGAALLLAGTKAPAWARTPG